MATRNPKNITIGEGRPGRNEGRDGDMTIRTIRDMGTMLFVKAKGKWFNINLNKDLKTDKQQSVSYALPGNPKKPGEIRLSSGEVKTKNESGQDLEMVAIDSTGVQLGGVGKNSSVIVPNNATALAFKKSGATNMMHFKTDASPNSVVFDNLLRIAETGSPPSGTDSGYGRLYVKSSDGKIYFMNEGGSETDLTSGGGGGGGGHTIQNGSSNLSARTNLNFDGTYLVATDDSGNDQTDVTINGTDGGFDGDVMQIGTALTGLNSNSASTTVRAALQSIDVILALLAPAKPSDLSALSLSYYNTTTYTAKQSSTGNTITSQVTTDTTPRFSVSNFYNGDSGTVSTFRDSTAGGTKVLSTSSDVTSGVTANNIKLVISADEDPHAGTAGSEGFYKQLDARIEQTSALSSQSAPYVFKIAHSETGSSGITKNVYIDTNTTPSISSISLGTVTIANSGNGTFRSGVPYMEQSDDFDVTFTVSNAISHFYPSGNIASAYIDGVTETVSNTTTGSKTNGDTFSASMSNIDISDNKFVKSPNITCVGYNASGTDGSGTLPTTFNIDSKSGVESNFRVRAGGGGNYPTRGTGADQWGEDYDSTALLTSTNYNEELQYSNGYFHYPTATDYSGLTPAGPDYSGIGTSNIKWMCQDMGTISSASSVTIQFNNDSGFDNNPLQSSDSFELFIKVVDSSDETSDVTGWLDLNASFSSGSPFSNGDACLDYANSDTNTKKCTFGATARTGRVFVRVGWIDGGTDPTSSSTRRFTSITMS